MRLDSDAYSTQTRATAKWLWKQLSAEGTVVRVKPNDALRVKRSTEFEQALKDLGCTVSIERVQRAS